MRRIAIAAALLVIAANAAPAARKTSGRVVKGDPAAHAIYGEMLEALRRARTLSFESEYIWETNGDEIGRATYELHLKKPNYARLESRSGDGGRHGVIVVDGRNLWIHWPTGRPLMRGGDSTAAAGDAANSYMRKRAEPRSYSIGREVNALGTGMTMPILDPSVFHGLADPVEAYLSEVRGIGSASVDGELCDIIVVEYEARRRTRAFWVARRDRLPRRLMETVRVNREIVKREQWRSVIVNAPLPKDLFRWEPPGDWIEFRLPGLADGLLPPGSEAPDFEIRLLDGARFTLSEQRGNVVWICFWRLACPPCRVELPHLDRLHEQYGAKGLVVLGVNFADGADSALAYLRGEAIDFRNAADTSAAVRDLYYRRYQTVKGQSAVPLNYIIDADGRVADAWYGYKKGSNAGAETLRRLGIGR